MTKTADSNILILSTLNKDAQLTIQVSTCAKLT